MVLGVKVVFEEPGWGARKAEVLDGIERHGAVPAGCSSLILRRNGFIWMRTRGGRS